MTRVGFAMSDDLVSTFLRQTYSGASKHTVETRRIALEQLQQHMLPRRLTDARTEDLKEFLAAHPDWSTNTRASKAAAVRVFYAWLQSTDRRVDDPSVHLGKTPTRRSVPKPTPTRRYRAARDAAAALADPRAILALDLPAKLGLRREEACAVHTDDVEEGWLRVRGKGDKERMVPIPPDVQQLLNDLPHGWVFPSRKGGHLQPNAFGARVATLLGDGHTTHGLRHRFGTNAMQSCHDLRVVADLMGHASTNTTAGYTATASRDKRAAVEAAAQSLSGDHSTTDTAANAGQNTAPKP